MVSSFWRVRRATSDRGRISNMTVLWAGAAWACLAARRPRSTSRRAWAGGWTLQATMGRPMPCPRWEILWLSSALGRDAICRCGGLGDALGGPRREKARSRRGRRLRADLGPVGGRHPLALVSLVSAGRDGGSLHRHRKALRPAV